jgi:hypothetical protein
MQRALHFMCLTIREIDFNLHFILPTFNHIRPVQFPFFPFSCFFHFNVAESAVLPPRVGGGRGGHRAA